MLAVGQRGFPPAGGRLFSSPPISLDHHIGVGIRQRQRDIAEKVSAPGQGPKLFWELREETPTILSSRPARCDSSAPRAASALTTPLPTVPRPAMAIRKGVVILRRPVFLWANRTAACWCRPAGTSSHCAQPGGCGVHSPPAPPHINFAIAAKADARRHRDFGMDQQIFWAPHETELFVFLRHRCPGEHRGGGRRGDFPAGRRHAFHQHVAARLVDGTDFTGRILRAVLRCCRRNLDGREGAIIQIVTLMRAKALISFSLPAAKPMRQPGME